MDEIGKRLLWIVVYVFVAVALVPELAEQAGKNWFRGRVDACVEMMVRLNPLSPSSTVFTPETYRDRLTEKALRGLCP
jgi:hypothetical protein